jgi:hypothetical protein
MGWGIAVLIAVVIAVIVLIVRRRRVTTGEALQLLGGVPATPAQPGVAWMFPGRGTPPDPDVRETATTLVDRRPLAPLPPGIKRADDAD